MRARKNASYAPAWQLQMPRVRLANVSWLLLTASFVTATSGCSVASKNSEPVERALPMAPAAIWQYRTGTFKELQAELQALQAEPSQPDSKPKKD